MGFKAKTKRPGEQLTVKIPTELMKQLRLEKVEAERSILELVVDRLTMSYRDHPGPLKRAASA